ncbi:MAG: hypothetical protein EBU28_03695 [Gammaproteobacteria bacterium]|nr:hypothetical protein [Gammaproteobacteria bacterium]
MRKTKMKTLRGITAAAALLLAGVAQADYAVSPESLDANIDLMSPSTWFDSMPAAGMTMPFNPMHPAGWAVIMNPRTHTDFHMAFTNPATYAQFMTPQFYMQFMNPKNLMAWFNPANYATFLDVNTYAYWMTPHAYIHAMNPANETFANWITPSAYSLTGEPTGIVKGGAGVDYVEMLLGDSTAPAKTPTE